MSKRRRMRRQRCRHRSLSGVACGEAHATIDHPFLVAEPVPTDQHDRCRAYYVGVRHLSEDNGEFLIGPFDSSAAAVAKIPEANSLAACTIPGFSSGYWECYVVSVAREEPLPVAARRARL